MVFGVRQLFASYNQPGCQSSVEGYGVAAATTAVGWCGWDVGVLLPAVSSADRRGDSWRLSASFNQPGCQSTVEGYVMAAATTAVGWSGWDVGVLLPAASSIDR